MEYVWPALSYRAWHFVAIRDPIRESHVIQPSTDALLIAVQTEGRWPRVRVAFEVDKLDRSFRNRVQELTQQQVPTVVNRIQLIAFSDFSDLCDPTRNERCFHCYMYLNGVALMDEDMQAVREGDHLLLRIIPRADLPPAYFAAIQVSAAGFDEQNFPRRVVHNSLVPTVAPWSISHNVALDSYCLSLWTDHGGAVLQQRWFTVWRVRSLVYHRIPSMRVRRVHPQDAWVMIDKIHSQWPDLQPREWSLMQVHGSYLLSPFLARHAQLVVLQTPLDTPHNFATVVLHRENTDAWASPLPRRVSLHQLSNAFGFTNALPPTRFTRNGVPLEQGRGIYDAFHGDLFTLLPEFSLGVGTVQRIPVGDPNQPHGSFRGSEPYRNRGPPRDYGGYSRSGASSSTMRPTDSIATSNAYPLERDSMPLRTFQQLDAQPVTHSFTDEFLQRWREIIAARQNGAPPAPQEGPSDLASDPAASPWGAARISRTQVLRPLRLGWNTIWRRHQRQGANLHHEGDPLDHLELHLIPHLTLEDVFELIFAYWPDLRPDDQWFLSTADDFIQYARRALPWRGELFFLNTILDGRPGHQIVALELPTPKPLVLRYVPETTTYWEIRHHLQAIPEEHILLNGIPWTERDNIDLSFLCAKLLQEEGGTLGNDVAVNFRMSRSASQHDADSFTGGQPRTGPGGLFPTDRPVHPPTPDDNPSDQVLVRTAGPFRFYRRRQRQGNKKVTFNDIPDYYLFDDDSHLTLLWQPDVLDLDPDPFPLPAITFDHDVLHQAQAREGDDCIQVLDMDTNHWSLWPWQDVQQQTFSWAQTAPTPPHDLQSGWIPPDHVHDLHQAIIDCPWFSYLSWYIPVPSDDCWYHSNTLCALPFVTTVPSSPIVKILIYTDGSYKPPGITGAPSVAAWSNVILVQTSEGTLHYWGHLAARCDAISAYEAEVDAMMVALLFSYYLSQCQEIAVEIRFDCTSADFVASFPSRAACKYPTNVTRGISQAVRTFTTLTTSHVAGHRGDPFNELANTFANRARICDTACIPELDALFDLLLDDPHAAQWLWARSQPSKAGFEVGAQGEWYIPCPDSQRETARNNFLKARVPDPELRPPSQPMNLTTIECVLATHNVLTLNDFSKNGKRIPPQPSARLLHLEAQWKQHKCALVGLQETRSYKEQCVTTKEGFVFITAANKGVGGCGLFVNTKQAYGPTLDGPLFFSRKHFTIVASEAEYLIVRVRATDLHVLVVVAHAPSLDKGESVRCTFWDNLTTLLQSYPKEEVILLVDANDTLDCSTRESAFQDFARRHKTFLPSCIPALHQGASWTHTSAKGQLRKRLDYVGVPAKWEESAELCSTVAYDADVAITREDHEMVTLAIRKEGDGCKAPRFRRAVPYQNPLRPQAAEHEFWRMRLRDLYRVTTECADFATTTCPDQHAMALQHLLLHEACQVFPKQKVEPRKPYVSLEALQLLRHRSHLRRLKRSWESEANKCTLWFYFKMWQNRPPTGSFGARIDHNLASLQRAFDTTCWMLRQRLQADKKQYFESLGGSIPADMDDKTLAHLWPILKFALPKQATKPARTLPREQMTSQALDHFATIESGQVCTKELLWDWHCKSQEHVDYGAFPVDFFPTLAEIEGVLAGFKHYKSPGEDLLTADLLQAGGTPLAHWCCAWSRSASPQDNCQSFSKGRP